MKIKSLLAIILIFAIFTSCEKIKDEVNKAASFKASVDLPDQTIVLDSLNFKSTAAAAENQKLYVYEVSVDVQSILDQNNVSSASIEDGGFQSVTLTIVDPLIATFDFVSSMYVSVANNSDFNGEIIVATTGDIPAGSQNVSFTVQANDISSLINENHFFVGLFGDKIAPLPATTVTMSLLSAVQFTVVPL